MVNRRTSQGSAQPANMLDFSGGERNRAQAESAAFSSDSMKLAPQRLRPGSPGVAVPGDVKRAGHVLIDIRVMLPNVRVGQVLVTCGPAPKLPEDQV